jgi:glycosyltransferase involved in cell wall biosynthesis
MTLPPLNQPLRILHFIETGGPGGAETVLVNLACAQQEAGHHVECMVRDGDWLPDALRSRGVAVLPYNTGGAFDGALLRALRQRIRHSGIGVVHAHLFGGAIYAGLASWLEGVPCVATLHGQADVRDKGLRLALKRLVLRYTVARVVAVSASLRTHLVPLLRLPARRFMVIPNGVAFSAPRHADGPDVGARRPELLAIGNIRRPKNYPGLLDAIVELRNYLPNVHLSIAGQPDREGLFEQLQEQIERQGLRHNVTLLGFVADPSRLLATADCFVLASTEEGFSLATIEAMLAGVPVVATRSGGPEEILSDQETGLLVPVDDAHELTHAILRVLESRELARALAERARAVAESRFRLASMVSAYDSLYRALTACAPRVRTDM